MEGEGISQLSILLQKPYLVKWSSKEGEGQNVQKNCSRGLWMAPSSSWNLDHMIQVKKIRYQKEMSHCRQHGKVVNK